MKKGLYLLTVVPLQLQQYPKQNAHNCRNVLLAFGNEGSHVCRED